MGDIEAIISCIFDFDLKEKKSYQKKKKKICPFSKKVVEDNRAIIFFRPKQ